LNKLKSCSQSKKFPIKLLPIKANGSKQAAAANQQLVPHTVTQLSGLLGRHKCDFPSIIASAKEREIRGCKHDKRFILIARLHRNIF